MLVSFAVRKVCLSKVANPVSSSLGVSDVGSVAAVNGTTVVGCGAQVAIETSRSADAMETASLKQPMHTVVVLGEMAANTYCEPLARLAIGSLPTAPETHLLHTLRFYGLYVKTGRGRVKNRNVKYTMVE